MRNIDLQAGSPQQIAVQFVEAHAQQRKAEARKTLAHICKMSNVPFECIDDLIALLQTHGRVGTHFHPDRIAGDGRSVAEALLADGYYRNQFETLLSNGALSPERGGPRDRWENQLFGDAYQRNVPLSIRPKYGAVTLMRHPDGPSPRFGSCYFVLKPIVSSRCTFCFGDSHLNPESRGTSRCWDDILCALLTEAFVRDGALGRKNMRPAALIKYLLRTLALPFADPSKLTAARNLDHYIEAQIHGEIDLMRDAEYLVVDPSFRSTTTGEQLVKLCARYDIQLLWHMGFQLHTSEVPDDFRGPLMPALAKYVALDGVLTIEKIGAATVKVQKEPEKWSEFGDQAAVLQLLKLLWHVLLRYGKIAIVDNYTFHRS